MYSLYAAAFFDPILGNHDLDGLGIVRLREIFSGGSSSSSINELDLTTEGVMYLITAPSCWFWFSLFGIPVHGIPVHALIFSVIVGSGGSWAVVVLLFPKREESKRIGVAFRFSFEDKVAFSSPEEPVSVSDGWKALPATFGIDWARVPITAGEMRLKLRSPYFLVSTSSRSSSVASKDSACLLSCLRFSFRAFSSFDLLLLAKKYSMGNDL
mmetsp:Transcript_19403/g.39884  ORF Transcript_19403/g.39884 Transcript_19403/m.39884 type:complete len:212 (-) Transcript_19403:456-1091(-)